MFSDGGEGELVIELSVLMEPLACMVEPPNIAVWVRSQSRLSLSTVDKRNREQLHMHSGVAAGQLAPPGPSSMIYDVGLPRFEMATRPSKAGIYMYNRLPTHGRYPWISGCGSHCGGST